MQSYSDALAAAGNDTARIVFLRDGSYRTMPADGVDLIKRGSDTAESLGGSLRTILSAKSRIDIPPGVLTLNSGQYPIVIRQSIALVGNGSVIDCCGYPLFQLSDGVSITIQGIKIVNCPRIVYLTGNNNHGLIKVSQCEFDACGPVVDGGCSDVGRLVFVDSEVKNSVGEYALNLNAHVKSAKVTGNYINGLTSQTSSAQVFRLGKTQIPDAPLTGNYIISKNHITNIIANGAEAGEVHAIIVFGERAIISKNIITNLDRPYSRQAGGVEGIYTKTKSCVVSKNILTDAGFAEGNKGAFINIKGATLLNGIASNDPTGALTIVSGNVCVSTDAHPRNGIRVEPDRVSVIDNTLHAMSGHASIILAWPDASSQTAKVCGNTISSPRSLFGIWINAVGRGVFIKDNTIEARTGPIIGGESAIEYSDNSRSSGAMTRLRISHNDIDASGYENAISINSVGINVNNLAIRDNNICGGSYGIRTSPLVISGSCSGNEMIDTEYAYRYKSAGVVYSGNTLNYIPS